jgi:hypothetical protein
MHKWFHLSSKPTPIATAARSGLAASCSGHVDDRRSNRSLANCRTIVLAQGPRIGAIDLLVSASEEASREITINRFFSYIAAFHFINRLKGRRVLFQVHGPDARAICRCGYMAAPYQL